MPTTASVYYNKIKVDYPQAGKDNDSQGFRNNFKNILNAFSSTDALLDSLNVNAVKLGETNDFGYNVIKKSTIQSQAVKVNDETLNVRTGNITVNYELGNFQKFKVGTGTSTLNVINWPQNDLGKILIQVSPEYTTATVTFAGSFKPVGTTSLPVEINSTSTTFFEVWSDDYGNTTFINNLNDDTEKTFTHPVTFSGGLISSRFFCPAILFNQTEDGGPGMYKDIGGLDTTAVVIRSGPTGSSKYFVFDSNGDATAEGTWQTSSDLRLKEDITDIDNALNKVVALRGVKYKLKTSGEYNLGLIAQEVNPIVPELVDQKNEYLSIKYGNSVALLIEAIKELNLENQNLKKEIFEIKKKLGI